MVLLSRPDSTRQLCQSIPAYPCVSPTPPNYNTPRRFYPFGWTDIGMQVMSEHQTWLGRTMARSGSG